MSFNMWTDYLGLSATLQTTEHEPADGKTPKLPGHRGTSPVTQEGPNQEAGASALSRRTKRQRRCPLPTETPAPQAPGNLTSNPHFTGCSFCRHNGEAPRFYEAHSLKDSRGKVVCPILRSYTCTQCGATGEQAHTRRFCPLTKDTYTSVYQSTGRNHDGKKNM
ncbi:hypothetical protein GDO78_019409 [Eleutherodactylus coqui]|uniref:Nanos-type domain-containing protein n=1 Tax=Eleutherodactylus coqui TaxID=57060 RepID=A0A8J6EMZ0_ELECQ|nr:hypothetical protein GDO78_019409 [Eleutherodactylus coqui]